MESLSTSTQTCLGYRPKILAGDLNKTIRTLIKTSRRLTAPGGVLSMTMVHVIQAYGMIFL